MAVDADDAGGRTPRRPSLPRPGLRDHANIAAAALFVAALAIAGTIAWRQHHRSPPPAPVVTVGAIDEREQGDQRVAHSIERLLSVRSPA